MSKRLKRTKPYKAKSIVGINRSPAGSDYCFCKSGKKYKSCCQRKLIAYSPQSNSSMNFINIAGISILRPNSVTERELIKKAQMYLLEEVKPGKYVDFNSIDTIFKRQVDFFGDYFDTLIPRLASRDFMEFLLWQYDQTGILDELKHEGKLEFQALAEWAKIGPTFRRALKYMAERTTMLSPEALEDVNKQAIVKVSDEALICAEELINYCILSDQTRLFHDKSVVIVQENGVINHSIMDQSILTIEQRESQFANDKAKIYDTPDFPSNIDLHAEFLDDALKSTIGSSYKEAFQILRRLQTGVNTLHNGFPVVFVRKSTVESKLAEIFGKTTKEVSRILDGFTLTKEDMIKEGRDYWNPQLHYRSFRRGMFLLPHSTGPHFAWGSSLFNEAFLILLHEVSYGQFPNEWRSSQVNTKLGALVVEQGKWYEQQCVKQLQKLGIVGVCSRSSIGLGKDAIEVEPGEIDFIGVSTADSSIMVLEFKMLQHGSEPKKWRSSVDSFIVDKQKNESFVSKLTKKVEWIQTNLSAVRNALLSENVPVCNHVSYLDVAFITYAPEVASYFVDKYPCVSLNEFVNDYNKTGHWPYHKGRLCIKSN